MFNSLSLPCQKSEGEMMTLFGNTSAVIRRKMVYGGVGNLFAIVEHLFC